MEAIFSSKVYRYSDRKEKIGAALADPVNAELVKQLKKYLDPEYQHSIYLDPDSSEEFLEGGSHETEKSSESTNNTPPPEPHISFHGVPTAPEVPAEEFSEEVDSDQDEETEVVDETVSEESSEGEVEEATKIVSCTDVKSAVQEIKGTLNARYDTRGVTRVHVKDTELWIHYNDSISLNNVMDTVIELLVALGYSYLYFDRLARSENAIVFRVDVDSTPEDVSQDE